MPELDLDGLSPGQLLALHARIGEVLRSKGITRTANNPTGDLAEYLFCRAFDWDQARNSKKGIDAVCSQGVRYQIKGRRVTPANPSRQLSAIRELENEHFDFLAGVIFDGSYNVHKAALIPPAIVHAQASYVMRTNSHKFILRDDVWEAKGVQDVTEALREASRIMG